MDARIPIVEVPALDRSSIGGVCKQIIDMTPPAAAIDDQQHQAANAPAAALLLILIGGSCVVNPPPVEDVVGDQLQETTTVFLTIQGRVVQGFVPSADDSDKLLLELPPGLVLLDDDNNPVCHPIILKVAAAGGGYGDGDGLLVTLRASAKIYGPYQEKLRSTLLGGLQGHVLGHVGSLPAVYNVLKIDISLLSEMWNPYRQEMRRVKRVEENQELLLIIGTMSTYGRVRRVEGSNVKTFTVVGLTPNVCAWRGDNILICRYLELGWHLIGRGVVVAGRSIAVADNLFF